MNRNINLGVFACILLLLVGLFGCDKSAPLTVPPARASFLGNSSGTYYVLDDPNSYYAVHVGFTNVADKDRTINFTVTPSGSAKEGVDYTIPSTSVTIPAGQTIDSLVVKGMFAGFADDHVDTLSFAITGGDAEGLSGDSTFTLILNKSCPYTADNFSGDMQVVTDEWGDYQAGDIVPVTKIDETHVSFEYAATDAKPIIITIDPVANTTSVAKQVYGAYPSTGYGNYSVQSMTGSSDNYIDPCGKVISVRLQHTVSAGSFGDYAIVLKKVD